IFIADGHHRYETAIEFKNEMGEKGLLKTGTEPFNYVMMFLVNMEDDGLTILPTHRLAHIEIEQNIKESLSLYFDIETIDFDGSTVERAKQGMFKAMQERKNSLGMLVKGREAFHVLSFKGSYSDIDS
ncbi:MAG: DUF1015 family protein, partial [Candidatus Aminicenantes bacterium]|nr:DUF1015 family protein [Candidatus Aminicenantes bacterium]